MNQGSPKRNVFWNLRSRLLTCLLFLIFLDVSSAQTTTTAPTTTTTFSPFAGIGTTTITSTTALSLFTESGGTTLLAADSAAPTTTVATDYLEATTEGQASNDAISASGPRGGYNRFESNRNKPFANQEATTTSSPGDSGGPSKVKSDEKKIAWKFGRGGNSQEGWSVPNNGYPLWKKQSPVATGSGPGVEQSTDANGKKNNDQQAYIVWSVGQGNPPNGWTLSGGTDGWTPDGAAPVSGGWAPADASAGGNPVPAGWNAGGWTEDQSSDEEDTQDGWTDDENAPGDNTGGGGGWTNAEPGGWDAPPVNTGSWSNGPSSPPATVGNGPPPNGWAPQANGPVGGWNDAPGQAANNGVRGPVAPQQGGNGWAAPQQVQQGGNGWVTPQQVQQGGNGWTTQQATGGPPAGAVQGSWGSNGGGWTNPLPPTGGSGAWNNAAPTGGWNKNQASGGEWSDGSPGGSQDAGLSWKVYNEDTQTMENLDDSSGWKVVSDGGLDSWKLVNENGNIEWKIENINGEWKVTSADELHSDSNSTSSINETTVATTDATNVTSGDVSTTTTPVPSGGWDDDKQGRYIVWKFSENGKGEARVYSGKGAEPEVWSVGDNNQYWKETMKVKAANNNGQGAWTPDAGSNPNSDTTSGTENDGWNANGGGWQEGGGWQDQSQQPDSGSWQNTGGNIPQQNAGWQAGGGGPPPQVPVTRWKATSPAAPTGSNWQTGSNVPPQSGNGRGWKSGSGVQQNGGNGWQQKVAAAPQANSWANGPPTSQQSEGWQNAPPQVNGGWNTPGNTPQTSGGWKNAGSSNQPPTSQVRWQNGAASPQTTNGWGPGGNVRKGRTKGGRRNQATTGGNSNNWQPNKASNARKTNARGSWNNRNRAPPWNQVNVATTPTSWNGGPAPSVSPPVANTNGGGGGKIWNNGGNNKARGAGGWSGGPSSASKNGQAVPYIIVIKNPEGSGTGGVSNSWSNNGNPANTNEPKSSNGNKPKNSRRSSGWKMNRAGSSGWQWNPQGGSEGWKWMDGWMGSGGGFGGWMGDKGTMYSGWRPTKVNGASSTTSKSPNQRVRGPPRSNKKSASKMVFVFGTKRNAAGGSSQPNTNGRKKGKQVIILDYSTAGKKAPKGEDGMKKDIESVIQALRSTKPAGVQRTAVWKRRGQVQNQQQWG